MLQSIFEWLLVLVAVIYGIYKLLEKPIYFFLIVVVWCLTIGVGGALWIFALVGLLSGIILLSIFLVMMSIAIIFGGSIMLCDMDNYYETL